MLLVKFCYAEKSKRYIGWTWIEGKPKPYYASGDNLKSLLDNLKVNLKYRHHIDEVLALDVKPSSPDEMPVGYMEKRFVTSKVLGQHPRKEQIAKRKTKKKLMLLDRETLERNLKKMADEDVIINGVDDVKCEQPKFKFEKPMPNHDKEYQYKIEEDEDGKKLVIFELVKVAEWKLAK